MHDLLCGKLLGDGCLTKQSGRKPRFQFIHCKKDGDWANYCYEQLLVFLPLRKPKYKRTSDHRIEHGFTESYIIQSRTSELVTQLYSLWYPKGRKQLPFSYIEENFSDQTLAWWYQDDGHYKQEKGIPRKIILSTDSFSLQENHFLIQLLKLRYGLQFSLDAQNRLLLYEQFQIIYFLNIVDPHIHESMARKKKTTGKSKKIPARTTIYLPSNFILTKPTSEINHQYSKLSALIALASNHSNFYKQTTSWINIPVTYKPYQISIKPEAKTSLELLRNQTGLNISKLTEWCFRL